MKNKKVYFLLLMLFLIGLVLIFNKQLSSFLVKKETEKYTVVNYRIDDLKKNNIQEGEYDFSLVEDIDELDVYRTIGEDNLPVIGGIEIPSVGINLPIFKGLKEANLIYGAGTMNENQVMGEGNYALASHRSIHKDIRFTPLEGIRDRDIIYITDLENVYQYEVYLKKQVEPTDIQYLDEIPGKNVITLITCGKTGNDTRIVVQGELVSVAQFDDSIEE